MSADLDIKPVVDVKPDIDVKPVVEQDEQQQPVKTEDAEPTLKQESDGESELDTPSGSTSPSRSPSPTPEQVKRVSKKNGKKGEQHPVQLIGDLPRAEADALRTFMELRQCEYQNARIGRSRNLEEGFACECKDSEDGACGAGSDCINRLTQIECLDSECRPSCLNQRFEKRQFADIHVVKTEMKGFGLRAATDLDKDAFVYEYLGEVVDTARFTKRMKQYADEGIRHFYFMMLQKDEFIDATKKGGLGRFANHSCNPNCYVAKWTVGKRVRMGIFSSRAVKKDEELTFNYNVDRYGHEAQTCYCGEPNCVGSIGGKTQTDVATLDDLYLDALGISEEVELLGLKGSKKTKGRKLGVDYMPEVKPLIKDDMVKIVQALRQASSRKVVERLLGRLKVTDDGPTFREGMRLRILSALGSLFEEWSEDYEMKILVVEALESVTSACLSLAKLDASKIEAPVKAFLEDEEPLLKAAAERLLDKWKQLPGYYRIKKLTPEEQEARKRLEEEQIRQEQYSRPFIPFPSIQYTVFGAASPIHSATPTPPLGTPTARPIPTGPRATPTGPRAPPTGPRASTSRSASMSTTQRMDDQEPPAKRQRIAFGVSEERPLSQQAVKPALSQEDAHIANLLAQRAARIEQEQRAREIQRMINDDAARRQPEVVAVPTGITQAAVADGTLLPVPGTVPELLRPRLTDAEIEERAQKRIAERNARKERARAKEAKKERKRKKEEADASAAASGSSLEKETLEMRQLHFKKLITAVVVKVVGKYQKHLTRDQFKDNARAITEKIYATEVKKFGDRADKYKALDEKQTEKMKGFIKSSTEAAIHKIKKQAKQQAAASSASAPAASTTTAEDGTPSTATDQTGPATPPDDVAMDWDTQGADFINDLHKELVPESKPAPQFDEPDDEDDASDKDDGEDDAMDVDPEDELAINAAVEAAEKAQRDAEDDSAMSRSSSDPRRLAQLQQVQTVSASAS